MYRCFKYSNSEIFYSFFFFSFFFWYSSTNSRRIKGIGEIASVLFVFATESENVKKISTGEELTSFHFRFKLNWKTVTFATKLQRTRTPSCKELRSHREVLRKDSTDLRSPSISKLGKSSIDIRKRSRLVSSIR